MLQKTVSNKNMSGWWKNDGMPPDKGIVAVKRSIRDLMRPVFLVDFDGQLAVAQGGSITIGDTPSVGINGCPLHAYTPPLHPKNLGDPVFKKAHNLRYAYIIGAMANGITSTQMVEEAGRAGMLGFFGAAGLRLNEIETAICRLHQRMGSIPFGFNLIHNLNEPELEAQTVQLYLRHKIRLISASAFMDLTLPLVYFRVKGIHRDPEGNIICPNKIIAKVSRVEVAKKFLSPPPEKILGQLVEKKMIALEEANLAKYLPMAEDLTAEADSGGHTDNRPALSLLPTMLALRDKLNEKYGYQRSICIGLGGGIATPESTAAAFSMGAAFVLSGSINQACLEAGTSDAVRQMLAETRQADVTMAPAADMFEMGSKVQVLKRGTLFPFRAAKLYDLYLRYNSYEDIPQKEKTALERDIFNFSFLDEWKQTKQFFMSKDPKQITRAEKDTHHKMALVFRSYLGRSSKWANSGNPERKFDYQIWCGPSMGAFNAWTNGSFLEKPGNRKVVTLAMNLLFGAAVLTRVNWLRNQNVELPNGVGHVAPTPLSEIYTLLNEKE